MLYFDILVSCQPQLQTPFLQLEGVLLRQLPLYFISLQLNHSLSLVFSSVNDQSRCVWLDMSYLLHFVLNQTNKKWHLQDWSGKALERDSRYLIHQVRTRYFKIFLISNLCLQNTILGQWLGQVGLIHYLGKLYFSHSLLVSLAAVFWMSRNAPPDVGGALRDIQKTAARETNPLPF